MKKVTILIFPFITLLFIFVIWHMVSAQYGTMEPISLEEASTMSTSAQNNYITDDGKIDINAATTKELMLLPGIGEKLAQDIIFYRENNGSFVHPEDLLNIKGISNAKLESIRNYIYIP